MELYMARKMVFTVRARFLIQEEFGYQKIVVEQPQKDENGEVILKKGKPVADVSLRDTENVPLTEDIAEYFKREVLPYAPEAWIDEKEDEKGL
ncbi:MAG: hypothetical protein ACLVCH_11485 [Roseburia inulinivorans]